MVSVSIPGKCPVCGHEDVLEYDVCPVCGWENDPIQFDHPDLRGGANRESLNEAKTAWATKSAAKAEFLPKNLKKE